MSFERGDVIASKYRVERTIGHGGMGVVLAARHLGLDELVAVKLVRAERAASAEALARFQREARAAARIKSEHVARVLDVDRLPDGAPYIVMELIDGQDLHALLRERGTLPTDEACALLSQACEGVAEAHALGMVHRDLKLKNLFVTRRRDGRPLLKVIDFGVVKLSGFTAEQGAERVSGADEATPAADATLTRTSTLVGSVHYMAPEQIRASNVVTAQADVWSLGVCLYELLTGVLPFEGGTVGELAAAIQGRPFVDVRDRAPAVPEALAQGIARALEKDLRRRFADVAELASCLAPWGGDASAPSRIRAILASSEGRGEARLVSGAVAEPERPLGRVESTLADASAGRDAVAADSTLGTAALPATPPAARVPDRTPTRSRLVRAVAVTSVAGALVAAMTTGRPKSSASATVRPPTPESATVRPPTSETTTVLPTPAPSPPTAYPRDIPAGLAASPPSPGPTPSPAPTTVAPRAAASLTSARPAGAPSRPSPPVSAAPMASPSSAYDRF